MTDTIKIYINNVKCKESNQIIHLKKMLLFEYIPFLDEFFIIYEL